MLKSENFGFFKYIVDKSLRIRDSGFVDRLTTGTRTRGNKRLCEGGGYTFQLDIAFTQFCRIVGEANAQKIAISRHERGQVGEGLQ